MHCTATLIVAKYPTLEHYKFITMAVRRSSNLRSVLLLVLVLVLHSPSCLAQESNNKNNDAAATCSSGVIGGNDGVCQGQSQSDEYESPNQQPQPQQCTLYMAQSTIPHAGLGIFTGIERAPGENVGSGDVLIPVIDLWYHLDAPMSDEHLDPTADYIWHGPEMGMQQETSHPNDYVSAFAPGLDAAINCHLGLINVDKNVPVYDVSGLHRSTDQGAGAITPYHNCTTSVIRNIPAGGELFKDYGDHWFITRPYAFSTLPLKDDFPKAETLVHKFYRLQTGLQENNKVSEKLLADLWGVVTSLNYSRTINALPKEYEAVSLVVQEGIRAYYQPSGTRDLQDLEQTGRCLDIIKPAKSLLAQAGRGLFATQLLKKDSIVAGTPMLQVQDARVFDMFNGDWFNKREEPDRDDLVGYQIMMNYCWKHDESTLYLCPYGAGVNYVNHGSSLGEDSDTKKTANVRLQWADDGVMGHNAAWLRQPPAAMGYQASPGLFIDLVATRDILPGEEILMDYGPAWEDAWQEHLEHWKNVNYNRRSAEYQSARDWNEENGETVLRTETEQKLVPYPSHMELRCLEEIGGNPNLKHAEAVSLWTLSESGVPCQILERREVMEGDQDEENDHYYKVLFAPNVWNEETGYYEPGDVWYEPDWIVRGALSFVDRPYSTDLMLEDAFRFPIGFPDALLPDAWRNIDQRLEDDEEEGEEEEEEEE